jgi:HK97 family phage portal protein
MFLSRPLAAAHLDPNNDALFTGYGGYVSASGQTVSPETALRLTVVFACVRTIAEAIGQLPLHVYRRQGRGKQVATDHPLYRLLHRRPNHWQTSAEWRETMAAHLVLRGNAYNEIKASPSGLVEALEPLNPDEIQPRVDRTRGIIQYAHKRPDGTERVLTAGQVLHLRGMSSNGFTGLSPIEQEREALGYALAAQDYGARFYRNGATMPGWLEHPSNFKTPEDKERFRNGWREATVGSNRFTTPVLEWGIKYHELGLKHTDMQYLETRKYSDVDIARIFRVPPHMVGILDRATWANIEQQAIEFVTHTLMPWLVKIEQALERDLLYKLDDTSRVVDDSEHFIKFSPEGLLRGDAKTRAQFYGYGIKDGWLTRNEARELEDRDPLDGLDEPLEPLNMARSGDRDWDDGDSGKPKNGGQGDDREARLAMAAAQRVVHKECIALRRAYDRAKTRGENGPSEFAAAAEQFFAAHEAFVAGTLALSPAAAGRYVASSLAELRAALETEQHDNQPVIANLLAEWETSKAQWLAHIEDDHEARPADR